jgi:hypothetical protein
MIMRQFLALLLLVVSAAWSCPSYSWGPTGHELVGQTADALLTPNAKTQVSKILGYSLETAAPWLDCVKSVNSSFRYVINPMYQKPCDPFMPNATNATLNSLPEVKRMDDYVQRNWSNCQGRPGKGCHEEYHFADVDPQNRGYGDFYGTSEHDIVHAINAALMVLQDKPSLAPFAIKDKKEALFLLAHLLGDLHQPLHVGAVYLSSAGHEVHPDKASMTAQQKEASATAGGNFIELGSKNVHAIWDEVPGTWPPTLRDKVVAQGKTVPKTPGKLETLAVVWASDTIVETGKAFTGLTFGTKAGKDWPATATADYHKHVSALAQEQVAKGGARLAQLLNTIWP